MAEGLDFFSIGSRWQHRNLGLRVFILNAANDPPRFWLSEEQDYDGEDPDPFSRYRFANPYTAEEILREFNPFPGKPNRWSWLLQGGALAR